MNPYGDEEPEKISENNLEDLNILLSDLLRREKRGEALNSLRKRRGEFPELALKIWYTCGAMAALLQEITCVYYTLSPPTLTNETSSRVCNALAILQCVASHQKTRSMFLNAHIPLFLYPFLNTTTRSKEFEYLRLTSLGVIGALVKSDEQEVIRFLLSTEIIPLCLRIMETGSDLSKTVACFILQKILFFDIGLGYICATPDRFYAVSSVLSKVTGEVETSRLLKNIIRCYLRLSDHPRAREALKQCVPNEIKNGKIDHLCDFSMKKQKDLLLMNIGEFRRYGKDENEDTRKKQNKRSTKGRGKLDSYAPDSGGIVERVHSPNWGGGGTSFGSFRSNKE